MIDNLQKITIRENREQGYILLRNIDKLSYFILWTSNYLPTEHLKFAKADIKVDIDNYIKKNPFCGLFKGKNIVKIFELQFSKNRFALRRITRARKSNRVYIRHNPKFYVCPICKSLLEVNNDTVFHAKEHYCLTCFKEHFDTCQECNTIVEKSKGHYHSHTFYCEKCYRELFRECSYCGDMYWRDDMFIGADDEMYCDECFHEHFGYCESCDELHNLDDLHYNEDTNETLCRACFEENAIIKNCSYKPRADKYKEVYENTLYIGFELEIEKENGEMNKTQLAEHLQDFLKKRKLEKRFYFKHDGSLTNGFEIVSHPTTLKGYHKKHKLYELITETKKFATSYKQGTCGLHFHLNRDFFTKNEINKLTYFFNLNYQKIVSFSKRKDSQINHYCQIADFKKEQYKIYHQAKEVFHPESRYYAVNTENRYTIEIRIFRGTLNYKRFRANLQFVDSLAHFVKDVSFQSLTWDNYKKYLRFTNRYNHLEKFLEEENL